VESPFGLKACDFQLGFRATLEHQPGIPPVAGKNIKVNSTDLWKSPS